MTDHKPCDPADPCSTAFDLASERNTLDGLWAETKDRLDAALAQVARLRGALTKIGDLAGSVTLAEAAESEALFRRLLNIRLAVTSAGFDSLVAAERAALTETADTPAPAPADDGWTAWEGGECPMSHGLLVRVKCRDGEELQDSKPEWWDWRNTGEGTDIVAYRIMEARDE